MAELTSDSFESFLSRLAAPRVLAAGPDPVGALRLPEVNDEFVPPTFLRNVEGEERCPILLVSAPGAMGKTTLAGQVAALKSAWVWDLGALRLGDNSLVGTIARHFGAAELAAILNELAQGEALFLFDAFDEAEILSGIDRIEAFVAELWEAVKNSHNVCAVLFARGETAKLLEFILEDVTGGASHGALWEIDFFEEGPAREFVRHQVARLRQGGWTPAYAQLAEELFRLLQVRIVGEANVDWGDPLVRSFLGYAPVLQAIASLLADIPNPSAADLTGEISPSGHGDESVLDDLLYSLLRREQKKVTERLQAKHADQSEELDGLERAYGPREQLHRLLYHHTGMSAEASLLEADLPGWLLDEYESAVAAFLPQHPFLKDRNFAGPAFRDYVLAYNLRRTESAFMAEAVLDEGGFVPTSLLFDFYRLAGPPDSLGPGNHAGYLYESATAWAAGRLETQTVFVSPGDGEGHHLEVRRHGDDHQPTSVVAVSLEVSPQSPVTFRRRLSSALIDVDGDVVLGPSGGEMELSDVRIRCQRLLVSVRTLRSLLKKSPFVVAFQMAGK